jgi:hypothetical protein
MAFTYSKLAEVTLASSASSIDFTNIPPTLSVAARRALASGRHEVLHAMALSPSVWACGTAAPPTSSCIVLYCPLDGPLFLALRVLARGRSFIIDPCAQVDASSRR